MKERTQKRLKAMYPDYFAIPGLVIYTLFYTVPIVAAFILGFTDWDIMRLQKPEFNGLDNFRYLFTDEKFFLSLKNTFIFAFSTMSLKVVIGLLLALVLVRQFPLCNLLRTLFFMPAVLSMVVIGVLFQSVFKTTGFLNTFLDTLGLHRLTADWIGDPKTALATTIVAEVWKWAGFTMAIFIAGLQNISQEYYESASIDGAGAWQQFRNITVPLLAPAITVNVVMSTIGGLKVFEQVFVMTGGGPGFASQVLGTYIFTSFSQGRLGRSTAIGLVLFLIVYTISATINKILRKKEELV